MRCRRRRGTSPGAWRPRTSGDYEEFLIIGIRRTAGLCALRGVSAARRGGARAVVRIISLGACPRAEESPGSFIPLLNAGVVLMGEATVRAAVGGVLALREAGRSEHTVRRHEVVLDRFAAFLARRGLN